MQSRNGNILFRKLHSMRGTPQKLRTSQFTKKTTRHQRESSTWDFPCHVKMSLTRGQYAWFSTLELVNQEHVESHQRLNVEKHSQDWQQHWLVGLVDGDGTFTIDPQKKSNGTMVWNLVFKLSLHQYNARAIFKAKKILGAGHIQSTPDKNLTLRIRDRQVMKKHLFPIFDHIPLLSNKHYDYVKLRKIDQLLDTTTLEKRRRDQQIQDVLNNKTSRNDLAPVWLEIVSKQDLKDFLETGKIELIKLQVDKIITIAWLSGFIEAEGSFYIVCNDKQKDRYCHAFGLSQQGNALLMQAVRSFLKIVASVKHRKPESFKKFSTESQSFYSLETTNWRNLEFIKKMFSRNLLGVKSLEFRVWERSMKYRSNFEKLEQIQQKLRKLRKTRWSEKNV